MKDLDDYEEFDAEACAQDMREWMRWEAEQMRKEAKERMKEDDR